MSKNSHLSRAQRPSQRPQDGLRLVVQPSSLIIPDIQSPIQRESVFSSAVFESQWINENQNHHRILIREIVELNLKSIDKGAHAQILADEVFTPSLAQTP